MYRQLPAASRNCTAGLCPACKHEHVYPPCTSDLDCVCICYKTESTKISRRAGDSAARRRPAEGVVQERQRSSHAVGCRQGRYIGTYTGLKALRSNGYKTELGTQLTGVQAARPPLKALALPSCASTSYATCACSRPTATCCRPLAVATAAPPAAAATAPGHHQREFRGVEKRSASAASIGRGRV